MSDRRRGPEPVDDEFGGSESAGAPASSEYPVPPSTTRPIAPYDPYRTPRDASEAGRRNVAAEGHEPARRSREVDRSPFLPDDDPLNAEAWRLEIGESDIFDQEREPTPHEAVREEPAAPRRTRRPPAASRTRREGTTSSSRTSRRSRTETHPRERPAVTLAVPRVVSGASLARDQTMLTLLGINLAGIVVMAVVLGVRLGGLPAAIVLRLDAAGNPALWGPPSMLWRLPLMSLFITAMFLAFGWVFHPIDRFAARFALAAAVVAQVIAWVAVILHLT